MKIFNTNSIDIVSYCQSAFGFHSVREQCSGVKLTFQLSLINVRTRCAHLYLLTDWLASYYCCAHSSVRQRNININCNFVPQAYVYPKSGVCISQIISTYILLYFIIVFCRCRPSGEYSFIYKIVALRIRLKCHDITFIIFKVMHF